MTKKEEGDKSIKENSLQILQNLEKDNLNNLKENKRANKNERKEENRYA